MTLSSDLTGRLFVVTGASSGLGAHFAEVLSSAGAQVALVARRRGKLEALSSKLASQTGTAPVVAEADIRDVSAIRAAIANIVESAGVPDGLINNAGTVETAKALEVTEEHWDSVLDTNLKGAWFFANAVAEKMVEAGKGGTVINIASITGLRPAGAVGPYAISKAGLAQMTRQLAVEWARHGIRVNALAPGYIETDLNREFFASEGGQALIKRVPQRRLGQLSDLDAPLLMLCDAASTYMTGAVIPVDGGHSVNAL
ncbi:SDR family oxidoreductase [Fodinicurvata fenggangensis]|uniref:SDR family oxidoreductase n=1 Tax=Fodinicurvata fenggangensis TaxID=1121830 RepID=UPI00047A54AC|nr:SDR family oxidoreductase [Fodinicurvata fenggangensis]